jgi:hypothetical protein
LGQSSGSEDKSHPSNGYEHLKEVSRPQEIAYFVVEAAASLGEGAAAAVAH